MNFPEYQKLVSFEDIETPPLNREVHDKNIPKPQRKCLFCCDGTKFTKIAHAISETVGNKSLISHYECDTCNEEFGSKLEDDLGKYMLPYKIITHIFGKKNKLISKDVLDNNDQSYKNFRIEVCKNKPILEKSVYTKDLIIEKNGTGIVTKVPNGIKLSIPRQHYNPTNVYLSFLKMAYSIMPLKYYKQYVKHFVTLKQLVSKNSILSDNDKEKILSSYPYIGLFCFFPGKDPLKGINVILWEKNNSQEKSYPNILFTLEMKNFSFTIPVLADDEIGTYQLPRFSNDSYMEHDNLDFRKEESKFDCIMSGTITEIEVNELIKNELTSLNLLRK